MHYEDIYLTGLGAELGQQVGTPWMVRRGALTVADARRTRQRSVCVATASGPELAAAAARKAVHSHQRVTGMCPAIRVHLHASTYDKPDFWSAACFVLDQLAVTGCALVCEIDARSNGMVLGLEMAASLLGGRPDLHTALITGGDRFAGDRFARYRTDHGVLYGDAGAAVVLSRLPGMVRIVSAATCADPVLEGLTRDVPATTVSRAGTDGAPIDVRGRQRVWLREHGGLAQALRRNHSAVRATMRIALADADITLDQARWIVLPFLGYEAVRTRWLAPLGIEEDRTLTLLGLHLGHLGAADHVVGLQHLLATAAVDPGDYVVLASAGAGMTWTTVVVQIMDPVLHRRKQRDATPNGATVRALPTTGELPAA
jgi:3-oxoacyl-[acyl-carrier-protein] synthase-3